MGGPGSVIYRVSYVNTDRNVNKLYFKHVSACPGVGALDTEDKSRSLEGIPVCGVRAGQGWGAATESS